MVSAVGNQLQHNIDLLFKIVEKGGDNMIQDLIALSKNIGMNYFSGIFSTVTQYD